ncbi:energy-coupling factor ABC transporter ATP-binding protein [Rothia sp. AR01]|uniref:Energy-coupling factor ABC transporter ATP-binding protein n=1 Tax=Rothia santali TaxID=2949643 RepID=A0A9X2HM03_9MICC|nr:ABC transporter ATP-binding protein [Rothia santali]MCP3426778.1 energy-coupling factor ABC transporter ATP-binding protein [Rothia santali]
MPIELTDARFAYPDGTLAVDGVTFTIGDGERVAIVGQNGAGKTTTVKMMNGLLKPTSGGVTVDGADISGRTTASVARDVGYVFQNPDDQIFGSDVQGELEYMPRYHRWDEAKRVERVRRAALMAGIGNFMDLNPNDLPFAIKKFVAIGAILVGECRYVILDEPTAGLDRRGLRLLGRILDQLREEGITVITITHDMRFVAETFDRVIAMAQRRVIADGTVEEVFARDDVVERAKLKRPEISQLARDLGLDAGAVRFDDVLGLLPAGRG